MDILKKYIECYIPTETCNLRCHYCYITQQRKFNNKLAKFPRTLEEIKKAFSKERLGGACLLNFCAGGETLLAEEVLDIIKVLLEAGHYVMVVTNGTLTKRFKQIAKFPNRLLKHLIFKFSFHYLELKRLNILEKYFENIKKMKACGCSFTVEITPSDELIPYIDEIKQVCYENLGALCHVTIARDDRTNGIEHLSNLDFEQYKKVWNTFDSGLFDFKSTIFYKKRKEFCYAGAWSFYVNLSTGIIRQCYCGDNLGNIYENMDKSLKLRAIGNTCTIARRAHCYNGHAFLTLGDIPELETPFYAETRNRIDSRDGSEWLQPEMKAFMSQKLKDSNEDYSATKKIKTDTINICKALKRKVVR